MAVTDSNNESQVPKWTFGDRLRKSRQSAGIERPQMAELTNHSLAAVSAWERDDSRPRDVAHVVNVWADATGVPRQWLMFGDEIRWSLHPLPTPDGLQGEFCFDPPPVLASV